MDQNKINSAEIKSARIDPALWSCFAKAGNQDEYCRYWLAIQCSLVADVIQGILVLGHPGTGSFAPVSKWPEEGEDPERLAEISERVLEEQCGLLVELGYPEGTRPNRPARYGVAYPILIDGLLHGVAAVEVAADSEAHLKSFMENLQWGASWLELLFRRRQARENELSLTRLKSAVDIMACVLSEKTFESASMAFVTEIATQLECDRVSLSFMHKNHARIQAISHSAEVDKHMNLIRAIGMAMDEAIVQRKEIFYPPPAEGEVIITRDHESLAKQHGAGSILTMPFYADERYRGALSLERPSWQPFTEEDAEFCRSVSTLLFPVLEARRQNARPLILKAWDALKEKTDTLFESRHHGRKMLAVIIVVIVALFSFKTGDYKISANTVLEGAVKRVVVTPFDGYVKEEKVRAGDVVESGMLMCTLDDRDLRLERLNWLSKQTQYQRQHQEALAGHNRAEAKIIKAQLDQATAQLNLMESRLERTRIKAPFKGIVLSGDLRQRLGGSVEKGEILFEVAPLDAYRIILEVDERRIGDVKEDQHGILVLSALPNEPFNFVVEKITPISIAREGLNYFRVEAKPETISESFRPGMEGIGKIFVDRRNLVSIWTRELREWVRLWIWKYWP